MENEERKPIEARLTIEVRDEGDTKEELKVKKHIKYLRYFLLIAFACLVAAGICMKMGLHDLGGKCIFGLIISIGVAIYHFGTLLAMPSSGHTPWWYYGA